jgi:anthranilate synthase/aminodeoxychorismate synthase-like glutamine amidotransferase
VQYETDIQIFRNDRISVEALCSLNPEAIIISPGPGHPRQAGICIDAILAFSGLIPILGICLGHQAIVEAFGGSVVGAGELMHGKSSKIIHDQKGLFQDLPNPFDAGRYHSLIADNLTLPHCLEVNAYCDPDNIMGIKHRNHQTYGLQFHPESILTPLGDRLMKQFLMLAGVESCSDIL